MADVVTNYFVDAWQRSILFLDVLRQRGEQYRAQIAKTAPHVLQFPFELLIDGRTLPRPVNYGLISHPATRGGAGRPAQATLCHHRSARRPWPRHWRLQGG